MAESLRDLGAAVEFIGSSSGIESTLVPEAGFPLHALPLAGFAGSPVARLRAGALFGRAVASCRRVLAQLRPTSVLGVGGYASAPAVAAARTLGLPTFLHEQNSVPGRVNRLASRFTRENFVTFPKAADHLPNASRVGMPTRREFFAADREAALEGLGLAPPVVLVFGGSGGALKLNTSAVAAFSDGSAGGMDYTVVQVAGRRDFPNLKTENPRHLILDYAPDIWRYVAASELVVSRAGAGSLFDLAAAGRASVLVPFPHATGDHQLHNARYFTERGAAELMLDSEVEPGPLRKRVEALLSDDARRRKLSENIRSLATPDAAREVARRLVAAGERTQR
ncbi:UDP-N-acetylglucosamine--N-acetylmuramyl-(pentapeptide) pyrophosphoryl-undecaprenol N-acetylglucosamine transferase [Rubrobacter radiotolerans]|uniref:UDP-N-acetylglucosamine--N-acetylmuramyl- (pentapeptide) pyrophosphoryl-undecaprenol N-acetylglucosamine transferase n=1 Tax=Rubrobacter radiotolerans TaxID=42256 RepID=UPI000B3176DC|nr:UDP-N-acetylglucosamine--N-acetylmuramyl-(pentapeptide) pyrophosphoryl-undecaprenol N-acetylglucosamine transferase [Rubrobacter radiotolerans]